MLETSLRRLRTDWVDVLLLHNPPRELMDGRRAGQYAEMEKLKAEGKIRSYGVSLDWREELETVVAARILEPEKMRNAAGEIQWRRIPAAYELLDPDAIRRGIEGSLRRLQTDHIDLYYVHIDDRSTPLENTLGMLNRLVEEGKVRYIACSNLRTWRLERARTISAASG